MQQQFPSNQSPTNQRPLGARPKTKQQHSLTPPPLPSTMEQSSSSGSTITAEEVMEGLRPNSSPGQERSSPRRSIQDITFEQDGQMDEDDDEEEDFEDTLSTEVSEEKADTSSMSSIEILSLPSEEWSGNAEHGQEDGVSVGGNQVIQPMVSINAVNKDQGRFKV